MMERRRKFSSKPGFCSWTKQRKPLLLHRFCARSRIHYFHQIFSPSSQVGGLLQCWGPASAVRMPSARFYRKLNNHSQPQEPHGRSRPRQVRESLSSSPSTHAPLSTRVPVPSFTLDCGSRERICAEMHSFFSSEAVYHECVEAKS